MDEFKNDWIKELKPGDKVFVVGSCWMSLETVETTDKDLIWVDGKPYNQNGILWAGDFLSGVHLEQATPEKIKEYEEHEFIKSAVDEIKYYLDNNTPEYNMAAILLKIVKGDWNSPVSERKCADWGDCGQCMMNWLCRAEGKETERDHGGYMTDHRYKINKKLWQYANRIREIDEEIKIKNDTIRQAYNPLVARAIEGMPSGKGRISDATADTVLIIHRYQRELNALLHAKEKAIKYFEDYISPLKSQEKEILRLRYLQRYRIYKIPFKTNYSEPHVKRLLGHAWDTLN